MTSILNNFEISSYIPQKFKINIKSFYVSSDQNIIFVTKELKVYAFGENEHGFLGLGHRERVDECTEIKELSKQKIKDIFFGLDFALALSEDNDIFG